MQGKIDAVTLLKEDHQKVKQLFQRFEMAPEGRDKQQVFDEIVKELQIHTKIEEEIFYPAVHEIDSEMAAEAVEEHNIVDFIIGEMEKLSPGDEAYEAKFTTLKENIEHHIEEEEGEMFPEAQERLDNLEELGKRMMERKTELLEGWTDGRRSSGRGRSRATSSRGSRGGSRGRSGSRSGSAAGSRGSSR